MKWHHVTVTGWYIFTRMIRKILSVELTWTKTWMGSPGGSDSKESACNVGDVSSIPGSGRSHGEGNGCPLQYSCLENSMDREAWQATVHGVTKSQTRPEWWISLWEECHILERGMNLSCLCKRRSQKLNLSDWVEEEEVRELIRGQNPWGLIDHGRDFRFFLKFQLENNCFTIALQCVLVSAVQQFLFMLEWKPLKGFKQLVTWSPCCVENER